MPLSSRTVAVMKGHLFLVAGAGVSGAVQVRPLLQLALEGPALRILRENEVVAVRVQAVYPNDLRMTERTGPCARAKTGRSICSSMPDGIVAASVRTWITH